MYTMEDRWIEVREALENAKAITWDGCHKIYLAMDDAEVATFIEYGYTMTTVHDKEDALTLLKTWYEESCSLRFVSAVSTNEYNPNAGFNQIIPQFAEEDEDEDGWEHDEEWEEEDEDQEEE